MDDDLGDFWIGSLFGFEVRGQGGEGDIRGCQITRIEGKIFYTELLDVEVGHPKWSKVQ